MCLPCAMSHQAFDNLQQLLHYHSDALVAQQSAHDLDVRGTQKIPVGAKDAAVCQVQGLQLEKRTGGDQILTKDSPSHTPTQ